MTINLSVNLRVIDQRILCIKIFILYYYIHLSSKVYKTLSIISQTQFIIYNVYINDISYKNTFNDSHS